MIRVLVMPSGSLLADSIVSMLLKEVDMEVIRRPRDELGLRKDYSVVVIVDEGIPESEPIKLKEVIRNDKALLLIQVSLESRIVLVNESYELTNPGMGELVTLLRDFSRKQSTREATQDTDRQKKMNQAADLQARKHDQPNPGFPVIGLITNTQSTTAECQKSIRVNRLPLLFEAWNSFSLYRLRRTNSGSVTPSGRNRSVSRSNKV